MNGFSILMLIFSAGIFIAGIVLYTGHKDEVLLWKIPDIKKATLEEVKNIGKWTMICSLIPLLLAIIGLFLNTD